MKLRPQPLRLPRLHKQRGFLLNPFRFSGGAASAGDPYWANVSVLMHMDGVDNGTAFPDQKYNTVTRTGSPVTKTGIQRFGTASAYCAAATDRLTVGPSAAALLSGPFTVEFALYCSQWQSAATYFMGFVQSPNLYFMAPHTGNSGVLRFFLDTLQIPSLAALSVGQWYHVAVTRDASNLVRFFIDGVLQGSGTYATNFTVQPPIEINGNSTTLGAQPAGLYIDELRVTKSVARYTANFTPPTEPFPDYLYVDPAADRYRASVAALLHMDGADNSTTFTDQTGRAMTATNAVISTAQSKFGGASGSFNGTTAYVTGPTGDTGVSLGAGNFTLEGWFYPTATPATAGDCFSTNNSSNGYVLRFLPGNQFRFDYSTLGNNTFSVLHSTAVTLNTWNHVAVVRNGTVITIYLNGASGGTSTVGTTAIFTPTVQQLVLGRNPTNSSWYYSGYMDDLRLAKGVARYTANFTPPTVAFSNDLYIDPVADPYWTSVVSLLHMEGADASTTFTDQTGLVWTRFGDAKISTARAKAGSSSALFDGTGDYLTSASNSGVAFGTGDFTIEMWLYQTAATQGYVFDTSSQDQTALMITSGGRYAYYDPATGSAGALFTAGPLVSLNAWVHIAITRASGVVRAFHQGIKWGEATATHNKTDTIAYLGKIGGALSNAYAGSIDEFRITKGVARYTDNFRPSDAPFPNS